MFFWVIKSNQATSTVGRDLSPTLHAILKGQTENRRKKSEFELSQEFFHETPGKDSEGEYTIEANTKKQRKQQQDDHGDDDCYDYLSMDPINFDLSHSFIYHC